MDCKRRFNNLRFAVTEIIGHCGALKITINNPLPYDAVTTAVLIMMFQVFTASLHQVIRSIYSMSMTSCTTFVSSQNICLSQLWTSNRWISRSRTSPWKTAVTVRCHLRLTNTHTLSQNLLKHFTGTTVKTHFAQYLWLQLSGRCRA